MVIYVGQLIIIVIATFRVAFQLKQAAYVDFAARGGALIILDDDAKRSMKKKKNKELIFMHWLCNLRKHESIEQVLSVEC